MHSFLLLPLSSFSGPWFSLSLVCLKPRFWKSPTYFLSIFPDTLIKKPVEISSLGVMNQPVLELFLTLIKTVPWQLHKCIEHILSTTTPTVSYLPPSPLLPLLPTSSIHSFISLYFVTGGVKPEWVVVWSCTLEPDWFISGYTTESNNCHQ